MVHRCRPWCGEFIGPYKEHMDGVKNITFADQKFNKTHLLFDFFLGYQQNIESFFGPPRDTMPGLFSTKQQTIQTPLIMPLHLVCKNRYLDMKGGYPPSQATPYLLFAAEIDCIKYAYNYHDTAAGTNTRYTSLSFVPMFMLGAGVQKDARSFTLRLKCSYAFCNKATTSFNDKDGDPVSYAFNPKEHRLALEVAHVF